MNKIEELIENNHAYWLGGRTTYLGSPEYTAKARKTLMDVAGEYFPEKKGKAIDVGCGNGDNTALLASHFDSMDGYELSQSRVEYAQAQNPLPNGSYKAMDIESELPSGAPGSMDAIFLLGVTSSIHNNDALGRLFSCFHELLAPDGYLITRDSLSPRYTYRRPTPSGYFAIYRSSQAFMRLFSNAGFAQVDKREILRKDTLVNSMYIFGKNSFRQYGDAGLHGK